MKTIKNRIPAIGLSIFGLLFCLLSAFKMTDAVCVTQGCSVYEGLSVGGISLYWFGGAAFLMLTCCATGWRGRYLTATAAFFLILDMVFLVIQILLWPCMQCLIVAAFFGAVMRVAMVQGKPPWTRWVLTAWFLLFFVNGISAAKEAIPPWPVYGTDAAPVHLYFSPTCPACREMIAALLTKSDIDAQIALYPIAKNSEDTQRIILLEEELKHGTPLKESLSLCEQAKVPAMTYDMAYFRAMLNTFKNMSALSRIGVTHIPFLTTRTPFWSDIAASAPPKEDCPMFSGTASGLCEDTPSSGLKELFKSK